MSSDAVNGFWQKLDESEELQKEFYGYGEMTIDQLVGYAAKHGFEFTGEELKSTAESRELSDSELAAAAGGITRFSVSVNRTILKLPTFGTRFML